MNETQNRTNAQRGVEFVGCASCASPFFFKIIFSSTYRIVGVGELHGESSVRRHGLEVMHETTEVTNHLLRR